jgi:hypothetical protein
MKTSLTQYLTRASRSPPTGTHRAATKKNNRGRL